jgi:hypothetical protein
MKVTNKPLMVVEDDQVDVMTIRRALKEIAVVNQIIQLENGEEALAYPGLSARPEKGETLPDPARFEHAHHERCGILASG